MAKYGVSEIIKNALEIEDTKKRASYLRNYGNPAVRTIFKYAFHPEYNFALPKGDTEYMPLQQKTAYMRLYNEMRRMYLFLDAPHGHPTINDKKRNKLWIQLLESIDPNDAEMLDAVKDKELQKKYKGMSQALALKVYPDLLDDVQEKPKRKYEKTGKYSKQTKTKTKKKKTKS